MDSLVEILAQCQIAVASVVPLAGDASSRRYWRVEVTGGGSLVACIYPVDQAAQADRDWRVAGWAWSHHLPVARPVAARGNVTVAEDLGDCDLDSALTNEVAELLGGALDCLGAFQSCSFADHPTAPFNSAFLRAELAVFERFAAGRGSGPGNETGRFCDELAGRVAAHPSRLVHRDFHVNNLLLHERRVRAIDAQDMRGGPDTYDLASLLRERGGWRLGDENAAPAEAARRFSWTPGWQQRYQECAAQRGLKVVGTFLRLAGAGRSGYLRWLPEAAGNAGRAVAALGGPGELLATLAGLEAGYPSDAAAPGLY